MDTKRYADDRYLDLFASYFASKYEGLRFDVVIASDDAALDFAVAHHAVAAARRAGGLLRRGRRGQGACGAARLLHRLIEVFSAGPIMETGAEPPPGPSRGAGGRRQSPTSARSPCTRWWRWRTPDPTSPSAFWTVARTPSTRSSMSFGRPTATRIVVASAFARDREGHYYPRGEANGASPRRVRPPSTARRSANSGRASSGAARTPAQRHGRLTAQLALARAPRRAARVHPDHRGEAGPTRCSMNSSSRAGASTGRSCRRTRTS